MLLVAVARRCYDGSAIRYVLPVLWMTSCFHIMERISPNQTTRIFQVRQVAAPAVKSAVSDCVLYLLELIKDPMTPNRRQFDLFYFNC